MILCRDGDDAQTKYNGTIVTLPSRPSRRAMLVRTTLMKTMLGEKGFDQLLNDAIETAKCQSQHRIHSEKIIGWLDNVTPEKDPAEDPSKAPPPKAASKAPPKAPPNAPDSEVVRHKWPHVTIKFQKNLSHARVVRNGRNEGVMVSCIFLSLFTGFKNKQKAVIIFVVLSPHSLF